MKKMTVLLGLLLGGNIAFSQENYSTWSYYKNITVNTTSSGANVTGNVTNIPVLVRLTGADSLLNLSATGADLRFTKADGVTRLKHQIERIDSAAQLAEVWVLMDTVYGNNSTQTLRMYWGKSGAADSSNGKAVFDTTNGFQGVWHLGEATNTNAGDATANSFIGTPGTTGSAGNPFDTSGVIGKAKSFRVTTFASNAGTAGAYYAMTGTATGKLNFAEQSIYTLSAWVRPYDITNSGKIISKGDRKYYLAKRNSGTSFEFAENQTGSGQNWWRINSVANTWKYVVGVRTGGAGVAGGKEYVDAVVATTSGVSNNQATNSTFDVNIGRDPSQAGGAASYYFTGGIDEVTVSNVARSADWISLSFQTQKPGASCVVKGPTLSTAIPPGAPTAVVGTPGNAQVAVSWTAPSSSGTFAITAYTVTSTPGSLTCSTTGGTTCTVTGMTNGTGYTFTVTATSSAGTGPASSPSATVTPVAPPGVPGPPTGVSGTAGNAQVSISWAVPGSNGGSAITGYTVTSNPDGKTCTTTGALTCTVTALTNGTGYTFTVTATNSSGTGAASTPSTTVMPVGAPYPPTNVGGVAGNTQVVVSWTASSNGGSAITGYNAVASPGGAVCVTTGATTCTVTGLTNGTAYTFTVTATNALGTSAASGPSAAVTPVSVPSAPRGVTGTAGGPGQIAVTWVAPSSSGGSTITAYTVTASPGGATCTTTGALMCTVSGLAAGTAYTFTATATNSVGTSVASTVSGSVTTGIMGFSAKNGFGIHMSGSSVVFHFPAEVSGARISVMDIWGRTVWSQAVGAGTAELSWNGRTERGAAVRGIYLVRLTENRSSKVLAESKVMLLP